MERCRWEGHNFQSLRKFSAWRRRRPYCNCKFSLGTLEKYGIRTKSTHNTGTEGHQPRSCSHQNHYVTLGIPQHGDSTTVDWLFKHSTQYTYECQREYHKDMCKMGGGLLFRGPPSVTTILLGQIMQTTISIINQDRTCQWKKTKCLTSWHDWASHMSFLGFLSEIPTILQLFRCAQIWTSPRHGFPNRSGSGSILDSGANL